MASKTINVNLEKLPRNRLEVFIEVKISRMLKARMWLAMILVRLAANLLNSELVVLDGPPQELLVVKDMSREEFLLRYMQEKPEQN